MILLAALLGGLGRRVCGGAFQQWTGLNIGDVPVRIFFGLMIGLAALLSGGVVAWQAGVVALATFLGCSVPMTFKSWKLGSLHFGPGPDVLPYWRRALGLELRSVLATAGVIAGAAALHRSWLYVVVAALLALPAYEVGWRLTGVGGLLPRMPLGLRSATEIGEVLWGASIAVGVYLTAY